jgi:hypothetical protein
MADDLALADRASRAGGPHKSSADAPRPEQLADRGNLGPRGAVALSTLVREDGQLDLETPAEVGRLTRRGLSDQDKRDAGGLELAVGAMQLHRVVATVHSAIVTQPHQGDGTVLPQIAQPHLAALVVEQRDLGQGIGPGRGTGLLPLLGDAEHDEEVYERCTKAAPGRSGTSRPVSQRNTLAPTSASSPSWRRPSCPVNTASSGAYSRV